MRSAGTGSKTRLWTAAGWVWHPSPHSRQPPRSPRRTRPSATARTRSVGERAFGDDGGQQQDLSKIVRDGRIGIVVDDGAFGDSVGELTFIAERHGGFVLSSSTSNERSGTFVLRIPERQFDQARNDIRGLATRVRFEEVRGDDVTAEFIDFQARLRILQTRRELLFDLFQQADTTDEILRMSSQLDDVTLRIEQIQGQLRFLKDQVAESTLRVSIQERNAPAVTGEPDVDNPDLGSSFDLGVQGFLRIVGAVIVGLGYLDPDHRARRGSCGWPCGSFVVAEPSAELLEFAASVDEARHHGRHGRHHHPDPEYHLHASTSARAPPSVSSSPRMRSSSSRRSNGTANACDRGSDGSTERSDRRTRAPSST